MYPWLVFLHILGVFGFLMGHGVSAGVLFALRRERDVERIRVLLEISRGSFAITMAALLLVIITGVSAGFIGHWWRHGWIWASLGVLLGLIFGMSALGSRVLNEVRLGLGLPSLYNDKPRAVQFTAAELEAALNRLRPTLLAVIGFGGLAVIAWLMRFKPF